MNLGRFPRIRLAHLPTPLEHLPNLSRALETFTEGLQDFRRALKSGDARAVTKFFEQARERRGLWSKAAGSPSPE